jgi:hypothetical protein
MSPQQRQRTRAAFTVLELAAELVVLVLVVSLSVPLLRALIGSAPRLALTADSPALDATCDQLRRELTSAQGNGAARLDGDDLVIGVSRWHHGDATLTHDGALRLSDCAVAWARKDGWVTITFTPRHLTARTVSVWSPAAGTASAAAQPFPVKAAP